MTMFSCTLEWPPWLLFAAACLSFRSSAIDVHFDPVDIIVRDIAIVGGGATGTYAAIRLQDDFNKSIVVVEREKTLGGHTHTYRDPISSSTIELGVLAFHDLPVVHKYFSRFNIPLTKIIFDFSVPSVDFQTGQPVNVPASLDVTERTFVEWNKQLMRFPSLDRGYDFDLLVSHDLSRPFRQFAQIHNLTSITSLIWTLDQGIGDLLDLPTLYVMKNLGPQMLRSLSTSFLTTLRQNNHEIYEKALTHLQSTHSVLLGSSIVEMERDSPGPYGHAIVATPSGHKLIRAKQFLFTIPPQLDSLTGFDLNHEETRLFSCFEHMHYFTDLLQNTPILNGKALSNRVANPSTLYLPRLPTTYTLGPTQAEPPLTNVKFGSNISLTIEAVQNQILTDVGRLLPGKSGEFRVFIKHEPYALRVSSELIRGGFYQDLNHLQGQRRSFWTGAAWHIHDSSLLWNFTETIITLMQRHWD